jgi:hypothetical protein
MSNHMFKDLGTRKRMRISRSSIDDLSNDTLLKIEVKSDERSTQHPVHLIVEIPKSVWIKNVGHTDSWKNAGSYSCSHFRPWAVAFIVIDFLGNFAPDKKPNPAAATGKAISFPKVS